MNILITGGSSGVGKSIVEKLCKNSSNKVYFTYNSSNDSAKELELNYSNSKALKCDFNDESSVKKLLECISENDINCLINSAFTGMNKKHFHKQKYTEFAKFFNSNIIPTIRITQECIKKFRKDKSGKIITMLSSYIVGNPPVGLSEYVAEKII